MQITEHLANPVAYGSLKLQFVRHGGAISISSDTVKEWAKKNATAFVMHKIRNSKK